MRSTDAEQSIGAHRPLPTARGIRAPWTSIPEHLRARVLELLGGGEVAETLSQTGGFSPGPAVRLRTTTGHRAFVKAVGEESNPDSPGLHRREAAFSARMPENAPVPKLLGSFDEDGWVILVFEEIDGHNPGPDWDPRELRRTVHALGEMSELARVVAEHPLVAGADPEAVRSFAVGFAGVLTFHFQRVFSAAAQEWLRTFHF